MRRDYNIECKDNQERKYAYHFDLDVMHPYMVQAFTPFLKKYIAYPEIENIVCTALEEFICRNLLQYREIRRLPVSFTGSVAFYFREQLLCLLEKYDLCPGQICQTPMEGLITFHTAPSLQ